MLNPAKAFANQFVRRSATTWLAIGFVLSVVEFAGFYAAAMRDGVFRIDQGIGLFNHYGLISTIVGNAISLYAARKYYDVVCSIKTSEAVTENKVLKKPLKELKRMVELRGRAQLIFYFFLILGMYFWVSNLSTHLFGNPLAKWGLVLDSKDHPWTFVVGRLHNIYTWIIIMPFVAHVMLWSYIQLWRAMQKAFKERVLRFDLLNPDQRGGFGFVYKAVLAFNIIAALVLIEITLHSKTFGKLNLEHIADYLILGVILFGINNLFFVYMYGIIKTLRLEALNKVKEQVLENDELSFEILKFCYERRVNPLSIANFLIQASAIAIPAIVTYWRDIVRVLGRA